MEVSLFTWRCKQRHITKEVALGIDKDGDMWIAFTCAECKEEVMSCVRVVDMMIQAGLYGLNEKDIALLKEMHVTVLEES